MGRFHLNRRNRLVLPPNLAYLPDTPSLPAASESFDIATISGGTGIIDITSVDGVNVSDATHAQIKLVGATRSSSGTFIQMQLRRQGGAFGDESYRSMLTLSVNTSIVTGTSFILSTTTSVNTITGSIELSSINQPCPTGISYAHETVSEGGGFRKGMTTGGARVYDAIRLLAGSGNWTAGTLVITLYRCKVGELFTGTFSTTSNVDITLNNKEYMADAFFDNCTMSTPATMVVSPGVGGTYVTTGIWASSLDSVGSGVNAGGFNGFTFTTGGSAAAGQYGFGSIYNLQTSGAPLCAITQNLSDDGTDSQPQEIRSFVNSTTTSYNQLRIFPSTGTITSGTYYIQTYKPRRVILGAVDLTSYGANNVEFTGLKKNNASLIVLASIDAERASADGGGLILVGTNAGYKTDYIQTRTDEGTTSAGTATVLNVTDTTSKTGAACLARILGLPQPTHTQLALGMDMTSGLTSGVQATMGSRQTAEAENKFKYQNGGGAPNFNAGTLYGVGYSL